MRWGNKEEEPGADLQRFWVVLGAFRLPGTQRPLLPLCPLHVCHSKCGVFCFFFPHERRPVGYAWLFHCGPLLFSLVTGKCEHRTNRGSVSLLAGAADCAVGFLPVKPPSGLLWRRGGVKFGLKMRNVTFSHRFTS